MAEDKELKVYKSKILEAAKSCANSKEVLKKLFPEAFEEKVYKCGSIFVEKEYTRGFESRIADQPIGLTISSLGHFWILAHLKDNRTYGLVNMRSGFGHKYPKEFAQNYRKVYVREDQGVKIPDEDLEDLGLLPYSLLPIPSLPIPNNDDLEV